MWWIALNTVKELSYQKIFYFLIASVLVISLAGFVLGPLSLNEQIRLSINFSLSACHLAMVLTAIYFASSLLSSEIKQKTALVLFTKPISYSTYIMGKFLGLSVVLCYVLVCLATVVLAVHGFYGYKIGTVLFIAFYGIVLESLVLVAVACLLSLITSSFLTVVCSFFIFVIGHSLKSLVFCINKSDESFFIKGSVLLMTYVFPNFEKVNWKSQALYQDLVPVTDVLTASAYSLSYLLFLLCTVYLVLRRVDIA